MQPLAISKRSRNMTRLTTIRRLALAAVISILFCAQPQRTAGQTQSGQNFALASLNDIFVSEGKAELVAYQGRRAVRLTTQPSNEEVFAFLKGVQFQDGVIEADIAIHITTPPGVRMPGFVGIAFRTGTDARHYDMFYLRPRNSRSEDQAMRNHSVQYVAAPGYDWYKLRREWPWLYESYADLQPDRWSRVRIEVHGRLAKLFVNGSENPSLIVDGMKGETLQGGIALWGYAGEEAYFSNIRISPAEPAPVVNGGDPSGKWTTEFSTDYGKYHGTIQLTRDNTAIKGTWSGDLGRAQPVTGTWRNGYVELTFQGVWPENQAPSTAVLAGWVDGDSAKGRVKIEGRADGQWSALRNK